MKMAGVSQLMLHDVCGALDPHRSFVTTTEVMYAQCVPGTNQEHARY